MDILTLCIFPLVVGVTLLLLEYFVIQPFQNAKDLAVLKSSSQIGPGWSSAVMTGIEQFRSYQNNPIFPLITERVKIEDVKIDGDRATIVVTVSPRTSLVLLITAIYSRMKIRGWTVHMASRYQLRIKEDGDVVEVRKLEETTMSDASPGERNPMPTRRDELVLGKVHEPVTRVTSEGIEVTINFDVQNWGLRRKIHPRVYYRVAQLVNGGFEESDVVSPDDWLVELEPNTIQPVAFSCQFGPGSVVVLTKPPHKVSVRLIPVSVR